MPRLNEALTEDVVENVLEVNELVVYERVELDELRSRLLAGRNARDEVIGQPEFSVNHFGDEFRDGKWVRVIKVEDERIKEKNSSRRAEKG